ncbi:MAG: diaminopimelate epimerase [Actinomycetota bacterium]
MKFVKSHGAGNDFVLIEDLSDERPLNAAFIAGVCDRHFGVGADGLIRITHTDGADFFMDYYNADGRPAEMCGNGIRCLAKYVADRAMVDRDEFSVATRGGVKHLTVFRDETHSVRRVRVDMGPPILARAQIPMTGEGDPLHEPIEVAGTALDAACVSMGNPHCIVFVDDLSAVAFDVLGPAIEHMDAFPARTNVEFAEVVNSGEVRVRVWERGVGETLACGTGACATAVASCLRGKTSRDVLVHLRGGTLAIEWSGDDHVYMTGPAEEVFEGSLHSRLMSALIESTKG